MTQTRRRLLISGATAAGLSIVAGCMGGDGDDDGAADDGTGDNDGDTADSLEVEEFEVLDRNQDEDVIAYVHDDHWHGDPLEVPKGGDNLSLGARIELADGSDLDFDDGYDLEITHVDGAQELLDLDFHGDHVHVYGDEAGLTDVTFTISADGDEVFESDPLAVDVDDHDDDGHDHGTVDAVRIYDRAPDPHEEVASFHEGTWDGDLPTVDVGDNLSLGAVFEDDHGEEIPLGPGEEYELGVRVATDADADVLAIDEDEDFHGDHVHVHGESEGESAVIFMLWHDDHADWESDPIDLVVES